MAIVRIRQGEATFAERIKNFERFVCERENIRLRKEAGKPQPWSHDTILNTYHFCNVRRADDRVTKWIGGWLPAAKRTRWFACAVARWINEPKTLEKLPSLEEKWQPGATLRVLNRMADNGEQIFNAAYIITGALSQRGETKRQTVVENILTPLWLRPPLIDKESCEKSWRNLLPYPGMGTFMAGQIVADWQTFGVIDGLDKNTWAPLGPGSIRGLAYLFGHKPNKNQENGVIEMRQVATYLDKFTEKGLLPELTLHDVQNCLCEFSKYIRGNAKRKHVPFNSQGELF